MFFHEEFFGQVVREIFNNPTASPTLNGLISDFSKLFLDLNILKRTEYKHLWTSKTIHMHSITNSLVRTEKNWNFKGNLRTAKRYIITVDRLIEPLFAFARSNFWPILGSCHLCVFNSHFQEKLSRNHLFCKIRDTFAATSSVNNCFSIFKKIYVF